MTHLPRNVEVRKNKLQGALQTSIKICEITQKLKGLQRKSGCQSSPVPSKNGRLQGGPLFGRQTAQAQGRGELVKPCPTVDNRTLKQFESSIHLLSEF